MLTLVLLSSTACVLHSMVCSTFQTTSEVPVPCQPVVRKLLGQFHTFLRGGELVDHRPALLSCVLVHSLVSSKIRMWRGTHGWTRTKKLWRSKLH